MRGAEIPADSYHAVQQRVVDAFFAAARQGDFGALIMISSTSLTDPSRLPNIAAVADLTG